MTSTEPLARILVVDDNEINRDLLKLRLEVSGYQVTVADGGREAMEQLRSKTAIDAIHGNAGFEHDLVLLDVMMPEVSGIDVLRHARRQYTMADLPIIMVTAKDESEDVVEALGYGANDYVTKPIDFPVLMARIRSALQIQRLTREKDEFLAIASHDLKNPLAVVRGFLKLVSAITPEGARMTSEAQEMLLRAEAQTETMERIITDFLDFQAMEDGQLKVSLESADLYHLIEKVVAALSEYARQKEVQVRVSQQSSPLPRVPCDKRLLEQVLQNLVGNAIKFNRKGGAVQVSASAVASMVKVEVRDSGPGITEEDRPRLFKKYSRLRNSPTAGEKSSGLGLAICKRIIELHNGEIGADANAGVPGTTFWFTLPRMHQTNDINDAAFRL